MLSPEIKQIKHDKKKERKKSKKKGKAGWEELREFLPYLCLSQNCRVIVLVFTVAASLPRVRPHQTTVDVELPAAATQPCFIPQRFYCRRRWCTTPSTPSSQTTATTIDMPHPSARSILFELVPRMVVLNHTIDIIIPNHCHHHRHTPSTSKERTFWAGCAAADGGASTSSSQTTATTTDMPHPSARSVPFGLVALLQMVVHQHHHPKPLPPPLHQQGVDLLS